MANDVLCEEKLSSTRTTALFLALTALCLALYGWRRSAADAGVLTGVLGFLGVVFLFYTLNYRTLVVRLTRESLALTFGLFTWRVPLDNVQAVALDHLPALMRNGGAGVHFMTIRGRYRASFNFLEYPRVVIALKHRAGPVRDISFSTRRPDEVIREMREAMAGAARG